MANKKQRAQRRLEAAWDRQARGAQPRDTATTRAKARRAVRAVVVVIAAMLLGYYLLT